MSMDPPGTFSISVKFRSPRRADLVLSGDVDMVARPLLAHAVDRVAAAAPDTTVVDLAAVTFAGATLLNFLASLRLCVPAGSVLVACDPTPTVSYVLTRTDGSKIATIRNGMCV